MRILVFYQYFTTPRGSWGTRVYEFSKKWVEQGHEVTVVSSIYSKSDLKATKFLETQIIDGIKVKIINIKIDNKQTKLKRIWTFVLYSLVSTYYALRLKADLVISSSGPITVGFPGLIGSMFTNKKFVFEVRDLWPEVPIEVGVIKNKFIQKWAYSFERYLYKKAKLVVSLSPGMKEHIKTHFNHPNVVSITNSANLALFESEKEFPTTNKLKPSDFYAIYTGNIGKINNSFLLVNAARALKRKSESEVKIVLVGDGQQKDEILKIIEEDRLSNLVHFGLMPKEDLVPLIQNASFSLVPLTPNKILDTSSPNKFFESLAAGVPIIQTTKGWIKEYIDENGVGFNIEGTRPEQLADLLIECYRKPATKLKEMRKNARSCAERDFDQNILAKRYLKSLKSLYEA